MSVANAWLYDFGLEAYETVWALQKRCVEQRIQGTLNNGLLIGEHLPVITLGRGTQPENLLVPEQESGIQVVSIERGGDVTYHGPGQLIGYPILFLPEGQRDLHRYLRQLEEVLIQTLAQFGIPATVYRGKTGVWVVQGPGTSEENPRKIASIGVAVRKWVTYHGIALNVNTNLSAFSAIRPCGFTSETMTSMEHLLGYPVPLEAVKQSFVQTFSHVFQCLFQQVDGPLDVHTTSV